MTINGAMPKQMTGMTNSASTQRLRWFLSFVLTPLVLYLLTFVALTWPAVQFISTHFLTGADDGLQNVWNLWWVNKAVTQLHQSPLQTAMLHFPGGTTLLGHTLNPFNGLLAIPLLRFMSLVQTHNVIVIFSFVVCGWTMFLLAYEVSRSYAGAILAGFVVTFSAYHFAHARGHLQLVSLEWVPLCLLCLLRLLRRPSIGMAIAASGVLLLVELCDHYYLFYCVIAGVLMGAAQLLKRGDVPLKNYVLPLITFLICAGATTGVLAIRVILANQRDPFQLAHDPAVWSNDLFGGFVPGISWRWAGLTRGYWEMVGAAPRNAVEPCVYLGWGTIMLAVIGWWRRGSRDPKGPGGRGYWLSVAGVFFVLSLGPRLWIGGRDSDLSMPYALLEEIFPPLRMSGMPVRMMVMVQIALAVLAACGFATLKRKLSGKLHPIGWCMIALIVIESCPAAFLLTAPAVPRYVRELQSLPERGGVIDLKSDMFASLYYQTIHEKPLAWGYISREPQSVAAEGKHLWDLLGVEDYTALRRKMGFGYLIDGKPRSDPRLKLRFHDGEAWIYAIEE